MKMLKMDEQFARRYVNEGFSGGEKKRAEILQMGILDPDLAIMDETDSGLDIDALRTVAEGVNALMTPKLGVVLITHYQRLLNYIKPQFVHILVPGPHHPVRRPRAGAAAGRAGLRPGDRRSTAACARRGDRGEGIAMVAKVTPEIAEGTTATSSASTTTTTRVYKYRTEKGLSEDIVREISRVKNEPQWMTDFRLQVLPPLPREADADRVLGRQHPELPARLRRHLLLRPRLRPRREDWSDVPEYIKDTFDKLGIPEAEQKSLIAGVGAQYDSEVVYHSIREDLEKLGVIFVDTDSAVRDYPEIVRQYFGTIVPPADNKFAALNSAVWSGGSFVYVPAGVKVDIPLQAYFRINKENMGQFERTLIIAEEGSYVHYVEGCTAPTYSTDSLHSAVVEIVVKKNARVRYTTIQNWSTNVYNLVTKRAAAYEDAVMEWVDGNLGSRLTMKYPSVYLMEPRAHGEVLSLAMAADGQHQDAGAKMVHAAPDTTSTIISKSVSRGSGRTSYRGALKVYPGARALEGDRALRRAAARREVALRHVPVDGDRGGAGEHRPRGLGLEGRRGPALLPAEPRHQRGRGDEDDRQRLRRADREGTADGVRGRAEPPHRAADGRRRWLTQTDVTADGLDPLKNE